MAKLFKNYVFLFGLSAMLFGLGIIAMPPLKLPFIKLILALGLIFYLAFFLFKRLSRSAGAMFTVHLMEFVIISLISAWLILGQLKLINIGELSSVLGFSLWIRSSSALIGEYCASYSRKPRRAPYVFVLYLALSSFGIYIFSSPILSESFIAWLASLSSLAFGASALVFAIIFAAKEKKKEEIQTVI